MGRSNHRTVYVNVAVEVSDVLDELDDDDLQDLLGERASVGFERNDLMMVRQLLLAGNYQAACDKFYPMVREALGTAI